MSKDYIEEINPDDEEMTVTIDLEDGPITCAIIVILTMEDKDYIVLLPLDENGDNEDGNVWIYRYYEDEADLDAEPTLEFIEADDEYDRISKIYDEFLEGSDHDEMVDDEE